MSNRIDKQGSSKKIRTSPIDIVNKKGILKALIKISLPILLLMVADATYFLLDSLMASNYIQYDGGKNAGDVLGFVIPILGFLFSFNVLFVVGTSFSYIRSLSLNQEKEASKYFFNGLFYGLLMMLVIFIVIFFSFPKIIDSFSSGGLDLPSNARSDGVKYGRITGISFFFMMTRDHFLRTLRTEGNTIIPTVITIISIPINLLLNWVFMEKLKIGLVGASYATLIASSFSAISIIIYWLVLVKKKSTNIIFGKGRSSLNFKFLGIILLFGLSSFIRRTSFLVQANSISIILSQYGDNWIQFWNSINKINNFTMLLSLGITQGAGILYGYYYHTKEYNVVQKISKISFISTLAIQVIPYALVMGLSKQFLQLFNVSNISNINLNSWYILATASLFKSLLFVPLGFYSSIKDLKNSTKIILIDVFTLGLPLLWLFNGINIWTGNERILFLFSSVLIAAAISSGLNLWLFFKNQKKLVYNY